MKRETSALRATAAILATTSLGLLLVVSPAGAARRDAAPIARQLEPGEVQNRSQSSSDFIRLAGLFTDEEEEKAKQAHEDGQDAQLQQLRQRVGDLEDSLRRQTGQNEQLSHRVQELNQKLDRMQKDFDYKLCAMAQQQMGTSAQDGFNCNSSDQNSYAPPANSSAMNSGPSNSNSSDSDGPVKLAPPPGNLGTLPADTRMPQPNNAPSNSTVSSAPSAARPEFDAAMDLLAKTQYTEARAAFRTFADAHPKDDLTPQAVYWVGNIAFVQKDYPGAARNFAEELKKYPNSPRAPESMLKLGQSFLAMNQPKEGCTTLGLLPTKYANASKAIKDKAAAARKTANCK